MKNRLEELRKAPGIKQEELAEASEVSPSDDWLPENGRYNPLFCWRSSWPDSLE